MADYYQVTKSGEVKRFTDFGVLESIVGVDFTDRIVYHHVFLYGYRGKLSFGTALYLRRVGFHGKE
jgi:hypothetical protein